MSKLSLITAKNTDAALELVRHDCAHIMAEAVLELYPDVQVTIGPSIENGFYYDFHREQPFSRQMSCLPLRPGCMKLLTEMSL